MRNIKEVWKNYRGLIEISNIGNVKSLDRIRVQTNQWGGQMLVHHSGHQLHPYLSKTGYYKIVICNGKEKEYQSVHRLVALLFCKIPEELKNIPLSKLHVDHIDGNKTNNVYTNLRWVTPKQNTHNPVTFEKWKKKVSSQEFKDKLKKSLLDRSFHHTEEWKKMMSEKMMGKKISEETKAKMSAFMKERLKDPINHPMYGRKGKDNPLYGKHLSEETKAKISEANKGKVLSEETKAKMRGRKLTNEHKAKLSAAKKGKLGNRRKEVVQLTLDGTFVAEHQSGTVEGFCQSGISACCRGVVKKHKGYRWMYKEDYDKIAGQI